jgi:hypothetical protein
MSKFGAIFLPDESYGLIGVGRGVQGRMAGNFR